MSQPFLLLVELVILGAVAYLFWLTRKAAIDTEAKINQTLMENANAQTPGNNIAIAKDIAALLQELESAASDMRSDWTRQSVSMQNLLKQAEQAQQDLGELLSYYGAIQSASEILNDMPQSSPENAHNFAAASQMGSQENMEQTLNNYARFLEKQDGRSQATIARTMGHLKNFGLWWGGQRYEKVAVRRINTIEIDDYYDYLNSQNLQTDTIRRKINAVKGFLDWIEPQLALREKNTQSEPKVVPLAHSTASNLIDRKKLVQALAAQGFDLATIAAKTNMERESVRMLLGNQQK